MFMLGDFIKVLRASDIRISTSESLDAAAVIETIGVENRSVLKAALSHALAKTELEKHYFDECFETYFRSPEPHTETEEEGEPETETGENSESENEERDDVVEGEQDEALSLFTGEDQAAFAQAMMQAVGNTNLQNAKLFTQQGLFTRQILEQMGVETLEQAIRDARHEGAAERLSDLEQARTRALAAVRDYVEQQIAMRTANVGRQLREEILYNIRLSNVDRADMHIMRQLIQRLAKRLASLHSRRKKKARRGVVDIRRTLRHNQRNDGILFELINKRTHINRPRLIVMCDVSGSVAAVARFLLMFLYSLDEVMPKTRSFAFSGHCGEVTDVLSDMDAEDAMTEILNNYSHGSSDYGLSLQELSDMVLDDIDHRTTIMILGDARSNYGDPGHHIVKDMSNRAKRVIWLNPEIKPLWNTGDSEMQRLGAYCHHVQVCNSLRHLETVMDDLLRLTI